MAKGSGLTYASAGVDIEKKDAFTESLSTLMRRTFTPRVIDNPGGFAGLFRLDFKQKLFAKNYREPVLVACCDGVGTKVKLASEMGVYDTVGIDLVAMNVNDLIVQGAEPLFFLDYIAVPTVDPVMLNALVRGIADGCTRSGCALLGGETANMPDIYAPGEFDLAGFCVGVVELKRVIKPSRVKPGDVILGLSSSGIHSNGYSLVRKVVKEAGLDLGRVYDELTPTAGARSGRRGKSAGSAELRPGAAGKSGVARSREATSGEAKQARAGSRRTSATGASEKSGVGVGEGMGAKTLGEVLLTPTRLYADSIVRLQRTYRVKNVISGMAHITGSGLADNLVRSIPENCDAVIDRSSWEVPSVFTFLQKHGRIDDEEMKRVFNLGIGFCVIVKPAFAEAVKDRLSRLGESVRVIGEVVKGKGRVREG